MIGRSFDVDTLRAASGRGEDETVTGLEELTRRGLIVERESGYDFSHDKLLDLVYERAGLARKPAAAPAGGRPRSAGQRADAALVARHLLQAGRRGRGGRGVPAGGRPGAERLCDQRGARRLPVGDRARATSSAATCTRRSATCTRCGASTRRRSRPTRRRRRSAEPAGVAAIEHKLGRVHDRRGDPELAELHLARGAPAGRRVRRASRPTAASRPPAGRGTRTRRSSRAWSLELGEAGEDAEAVAQAEQHPGDADGSTAATWSGASSWPSRSPTAACWSPPSTTSRWRAAARARPERGDRAHRAGARAVLRAGRPPPRGRAAQQPGRSAAPRRAGSRSRWST